MRRFFFSPRIGLREEGREHQPLGLGQAEHEVGVLDRLAGRPLAEVVEHGDHDGAAFDPVYESPDMT